MSKYGSAIISDLHEASWQHAAAHGGPVRVEYAKYLQAARSQGEGRLQLAQLVYAHHLGCGLKTYTNNDFI